MYLMSFLSTVLLNGLHDFSAPLGFSWLYKLTFFSSNRKMFCSERNDPFQKKCKQTREIC